MSLVLKLKTFTIIFRVVISEYVLFWLKSIHTYCAEDTSVIIVATHSENATQKEKDGFYGQLLDLLPRDSNLKKHLKYERCFFVSFPCDEGENLEVLSELENCIASIAKDRRWKENIPKEWSIIELALITMRGSEKTVSIEELKEKYWNAKKNESLKMEDALCFFHDIGLILHFQEENLSNTIIVDVQWFVDTFKFIISDKNHVRDLAETDRDWQYFHRTGYLMDNFLSRIWESLSIDFWERPTILQYMQRLGLLAMGEVKHYVPCMNKRDFGRKEQIALRGMETKSSVLVLHFQFLPFFFYCRLIVACIVGTEWEVVEDESIPGLYKNIAIFVYKDHLIALVVTQTAIQVQILRPQNAPIDANIAGNIKETLENRLGYLTTTFHKKVAYRVAFQCSHQDVLCDNVGCYVYEDEISGKGQILCPRHGFTGKHMINENALTKFWRIDAPSVSCAKSAKVPLANEEKLTKLITLGRDAMQAYFDSIFPPEDLQKCLKDNKESLCNGPFRFTATEVRNVYPASGSVVDASSFDVPIMYKLLRNFGSNIPPPTNGWGKEPTIGQKTQGDDIERIRKYRNQLCHNLFKTQSMDDEDYTLYSEELTQAILRLTKGSFKSRIYTICQ
ncbi:uncharacterized protein LOC134281887 [Saccostrea cucullata]|uniref:uncharacterized protein LOC134281887 n=2 Tax=Saccostrea cuccullata TaxID=36930 RepID=UPI002ED0E714